MRKTTTPIPPGFLSGVDRAIEARAAALEALKRDNEAAFDGFALQKQLAGERFEASSKRKAKVAAWQEAMERGEHAALDLGAEWEEAERWACAEITRRAGAEAGFELVREPGVTYVRASRERPRRGRSPRPATNDRRRGSRRSPARRSSERSGDSGDDSDSSEPPPRRLCAFCGKDIPSDRSSKATHCSDRHADRDRQRRKRARDRERSKLPPTPTTADFRRMLELTDEERAWLRALVLCHCNGRHLEFDPGECFRCGRHLPPTPVQIRSAPLAVEPNRDILDRRKSRICSERRSDGVSSVGRIRVREEGERAEQLLDCLRAKVESTTWPNRTTRSRP
jgi:hypothetical protein